LAPRGVPTGHPPRVLARLAQRATHALQPLLLLGRGTGDGDAPERRLLEQRRAAEVGAAAVGALRNRLGRLEGDREGAPLTDEGTNAPRRLACMPDIVPTLANERHRGCGGYYSRYCVMARRIPSVVRKVQEFQASWPFARRASRRRH